MFKPSVSVCFILLWIGSNAKEYTNPIALHSPDPWMQYYKGYYYLVATTLDNNIGIRKASTLSELYDAENQIVYSYDDTLDAVCQALELHMIDGLWYLFYSACGPNLQGDSCHRNHVLESATDDPMGPYTFKATLDDPNDVNEEIDPSYIIINEKQYLLGSYFAPDGQDLYIRPMTNPYTPAGPKRVLAHAVYDWETEGGTVKAINEGPEPLYHDDGVFVVYSTSSCWRASYKLGMIEFTGTDPLNSTHWYKYPQPVFQKSDENHVYGPGHNGFFKSPDGTEDWIVYHANANETQGCTLTRSARAQKFTWDDDGLPVFGVPEAMGVEYEGPSGE